MKNLTLYLMSIALLAFLLSACAKTDLALATPSPEQTTPVGDTIYFKSWSQLAKRDFRTNFTARNAFNTTPAYRAPIHPMNIGNFKLVHAELPTDWRISADIIKAEFENAFAQGASKADLFGPIQYFSLRLIHWHILKNGELERPSDVEYLKYFTQLVFDVKGVDIDVMADAVYHLQPHIPRATYDAYLAYLYQTTLEREAYVRDHHEEIYRLHLEAEDYWEAERYMLEGQHFSRRLEEARYVRELFGFTGQLD